MPSKNIPKAIAIDFFCGAGGTTRGFIDAGIYVLAGIDSDSRCKDTYTYTTNNLNPWTNHPPIFLEKDIALQKDEILSCLRNIIREAQNKYPKVPLIFSICAPCQPFTFITKTTLAKKTLARREKEKNLLGETLDYICVLKPDAIFVENVSGIKSIKQTSGLFIRYKDELSKSYVVDSNLVNAKNFGVPQSRNRTIMLAISKKYLKAETNFIVPKKDPKQKSLVVVRDVLGTSLQPKFLPLKAGKYDKKDLNHRASDLAPINLERIKKAVPGKGNYLLNDLRIKSHKKKDSAGNKFHHTDVYGRMDPKKVAPTITTKCFSFSCGRYGYPFKSQNRAISIREAAVFQSFPKKYVFFPRDQITQPAKQIGNAVPPKLSKFFGDYLVSKINNG